MDSIIKKESRAVGKHITNLLEQIRPEPQDFSFLKLRLTAMSAEA